MLLYATPAPGYVLCISVQTLTSLKISAFHFEHLSLKQYIPPLLLPHLLILFYCQRSKLGVCVHWTSIYIPQFYHSYVWGYHWPHISGCQCVHVCPSYYRFFNHFPDCGNELKTDSIASTQSSTIFTCIVLAVLSEVNVIDRINSLSKCHEPNTSFMMASTEFPLGNKKPFRNDGTENNFEWYFSVVSSCCLLP